MFVREKIPFVECAHSNSKSRAGLSGTSGPKKTSSRNGSLSPRRSASSQSTRKTGAAQSLSAVSRNPKSHRGRAEVEEESDEYDGFDRKRKQRRSENDQDDDTPVLDEETEDASYQDERQPYDDEKDEEEDEFTPPRKSDAGRDSRRVYDDTRSDRRGKMNRSAKTSSGRRVVPYARQSQPSPAALAFTRGIAAIRESIPDATALRETALSTINAAKETTGVITANIYREVKGLTSSELEQVMLKATRPDDSPAKGKHVERLVGVTYQISARYDIYDAVLRKLWSKMCEKDWRTTIKALYVLHRFSADGAPDHQPALKARLRELRRSKDPKRKEKYFNTKQLLAGDSTSPTMAFREFLVRYAHYVLLRAQCFGGMFSEMSTTDEASSNSGTKRDASTKTKNKKNPPISSTPSKSSIVNNALRSEHLDAAQMLLKAATSCALNDDEECENTAICVERVVADLIALTAAVAKALTSALTSDDRSSVDSIILKRWCQFYSYDLLPQTKSMMKKMSPILDTYGLFLPSRIGAAVSPELLEKGLALTETVDDSSIGKSDDTKTQDHLTAATTTSETVTNDVKSSDKVSDYVEEEDDDDDEQRGDANDECDDIDSNDAVEQDGDDDDRSNARSSTVSSDMVGTDEGEYEYYDDEECSDDEA